MKHGPEPRVRRAVWLALFVCIAPPHAVAQPTVEDILEKSQAAMAPPIQYRMHTNGIEMLVSQKEMPDGSVASRTEAPLPIRKISIVVGDESYEVYPDDGIAIDTSLMHRTAKATAESLSSTLGRSAQSAHIKGTVNRNGKECYEIETRYSKEMMAAMAKTVPARVAALLPTGNRLLIEKDTHMLVVMETMSEGGSPTATIEYSDIRLNPELPDDLFLPPDGIAIEKPQSIPAYVALITDVMKSRVGRPVVPDVVIPKAELPSLSTPPPLGPVEIDPNTGRAIAPVPEGTTREEFDALVAEKRAELSSERTRQIEPTGMSAARQIGIALSVIMIAVLLAVIALRLVPKTTS